MDFEWDTTKAVLNARKHGVRFADAVAVFEDGHALTVPDNDPDEDRFIVVGMDALGRVLTVVFTWRETSIRIISARRATKQERGVYEGGRK